MKAFSIMSAKPISSGFTLKLKRRKMPFMRILISAAPRRKAMMRNAQKAITPSI